MSKLVVGPFNRVEGDLKVNLDIADGVVTSAQVVSPLYRGFEQILQGRDPRDALVYVPRICGICSVSQSVASARALAAVLGVQPPHNGLLTQNLILGAENAADHLTHFYLFFMPDFAREVYANEPWHPETLKRFRAISGEASKDFLKARAEFLHLVGIIGGKWPHTLALQPGGITKTIEKQEQFKLRAILNAKRRFLERTLFGCPLEEFAALKSESDLQALVQAQDTDFARFYRISQTLNLQDLGKAYDRFMSYGVENGCQAQFFKAGLYQGGHIEQLNTALITEDVSHSWMRHTTKPLHPFDGQTLPATDDNGGYSWCKAPRMDGQPVEVGALSRQLINRHPLIEDLVKKYGGNVQNRVIARLLEVALLIRQMEDWVEKLMPSETFCHHHDGNFPDGEGFGLVEAARGSLGHWLKVKGGKIENYQIVAPTTWNFSPRDRDNVMGPLEKALVNAPVRAGETEPVAVQHIVRSFDPCMVCTVH
ncbi:nickel-dependent hydrogenase large subunit [Terasakiella pusilla]|uniref:nickel-dependent hydrogenase large subunit n=1 Tax=Terasakiella pusilla TaxID=64973 RepID=UPI00048E7056|nr:nickel-dependent hydrogenase large subunit [Terasakiella pusilla]